MSFDLNAIRSQFPALALKDNGLRRVYFDNPAGTQVPTCVAAAMSDCLLTKNANLGGHFATDVGGSDIFTRTVRSKDRQEVDQSYRHSGSPKFGAQDVGTRQIAQLAGSEAYGRNGKRAADTVVENTRKGTRGVKDWEASPVDTTVRVDQRDGVQIADHPVGVDRKIVRPNRRLFAGGKVRRRCVAPCAARRDAGSACLPGRFVLCHR